MKFLIAFALILTATHADAKPGEEAPAAPAVSAKGQQQAGIKDVWRGIVDKLTGPSLPLGTAPGYDPKDDGSPGPMLDFILRGPEYIDARDRRRLSEVDKREIAMKHINIVFGNGKESDIATDETQLAPAEADQ